MVTKIKKKFLLSSEVFERTAFKSYFFPYLERVNAGKKNPLNKQNEPTLTAQWAIQISIMFRIFEAIHLLIEMNQ